MEEKKKEERRKQLQNIIACPIGRRAAIKTDIAQKIRPEW